MPVPTHMRGAIPSPPASIASAPVHQTIVGSPPTFITLPAQLSMWGNDQYGDCVTAEEAFAKACSSPELFVPQSTVVAWATQHGVLNGASLTGVLQTMQTEGFAVNGGIYDDGGYSRVVYTDPGNLQSAIAIGPVKLGVAANQIDAAYSSTEGQSGWFATGFQSDGDEDHCVSLCGYGSISWLASQLKVAVPAGVDGSKTGYALYTWDSIGIIDEASMVAITQEAWLRTPTTVTKGNWVSLGGVITDPAVGANQDGRLEAFARGQDNALWHIWQTTPNGNWSGWASLGGVITGDPVVGVNKDGRLEAFARGQDNALWHIWQTDPNGNWSGWASFGGVITSNPAVKANQDGRLEAFARGQDNALWHIWQLVPDGNWSGWSSLGGVITSDPAVGTNKDGRLEAFARGQDNALWHIWQTAPNGNWSGWASFGGVITSDPTVATNQDGRLEAFARGQDDALWHIWQIVADASWSGWASFGGVITSQPAVRANAGGSLEAFARGQDNALWHIWQTAPNGSWSG